MVVDRLLNALGGKSARRFQTERIKGDRARDRLDWEDAEAGYGRHLVQSPGDAAILVQFGHSVKEQGKFRQAEQAYRKALALRPDDADTRLHLAHLLKRMDKPAAAAREFARLFGLTGRREDFVELARLPPLAEPDDMPRPAAWSVPGDMLYLEIADLLGFLETHPTVSGIQRVQLGVIEHLMASDPAETPFMLVLNQRREPYLWHVRAADVKAVADYLREDDIDHETLRQLIRKARRSCVAVLPQRGQTYLVLGAFWGEGGITDRFSALKRAGVAVGVYVYDLIPITHTEYCDEGLPHEFKLSFGDGAGVFDFYLTISDFTAGEVRRYLRRMGLPERPVVTVPLAHTSDTGAVAPIRAEMPRRSRAVARLGGRPFALMVSTIEARKNHAYLVAAWKRFLDEGLDPPDLVFVGRPGWRVTSLMETLASTRFLDGRVHILHDLSDAELTALYDAAAFTLFPSFVEGWGLPVGESLARGRPCVSSFTSSMPEVGGDFVDYLDPFNLTDGIEVIRRMAFDVPYRESRAATIRAGFRPRSWAAVSADLVDKVRVIRRDLVVNTTVEVPLGAGEVFRPGDYALGARLPEDYGRQPLRSILVRNWYPIERTGCWMHGNRGELAFRSDLVPGTDILLYLGLHTTSFMRAGLRLTVDARAEDGGDALDEPTWLPVGRPLHVIARGRVGADGVVRVRLLIAGPITAESEKAEARWSALGLASLGYARAEDEGARLRLVERLLAGPAVPERERVAAWEEDED